MALTSHGLSGQPLDYILCELHITPSLTGVYIVVVNEEFKGPAEDPLDILDSEGTARHIIHEIVRVDDSHRVS